jgi:hypothetical protein
MGGRQGQRINTFSAPRRQEKAKAGSHPQIPKSTYSSPESDREAAFLRGIPAEIRGLGSGCDHSPKGTDFAKLTRRDVKRMQCWLNNRRMKILGYKTPLEVFRQGIALLS